MKQDRLLHESRASIQTIQIAMCQHAEVCALPAGGMLFLKHDLLSVFSRSETVCEGGQEANFVFEI